VQGPDLNMNQQLEATKDTEPRGAREPASDLNRAVLEDSATKQRYAAFEASVTAATRLDVAERPWLKSEAPRNWFHRLLFGDLPDPPDPRRAPRVAIPRLVTYFFTGGTPKSNQVRDISESGIYVVTRERFYMGTIVRLTLTDRHNPSNEHSLTVNAKVVRCGKDGVGFEILYSGDSRTYLGPDYWMEGMDVNRLRRFIRTLLGETGGNEAQAGEFGVGI
jgi:hypothetical protein